VQANSANLNIKEFFYLNLLLES